MQLQRERKRIEKRWRKIKARMAQNRSFFKAKVSEAGF